MEDREAWIAFGVIIFVIVVAVLVYYFYHDTPAPPPSPPSDTPLKPISPGSIVNCEEFGHDIGAPICGPGTQGYTIASSTSCYKDVWSANGGKKVAICSVYWGAYGGVYTKCGIGIYDLNIGDPCTMVGPNYYKTAVCTCQYKGEITSDKYCEYVGLPDQCPPGSEFFAGRCFSKPCPVGFKRTARCTCEPQ